MILPKLSYVLLAYNREQSIRSAIESAFAQDYAGEIEFILSDDCSTDNTFHIIKQCAAAYTGRHKVIVTQTLKNVNLAGHTNHAVALATGDWIVRADDDDLSFPNRCTLLAQAIIQNPSAKCFLEPVEYVDDEHCTLAHLHDFPYQEARTYSNYDSFSLQAGTSDTPIKTFSVKSYARELYTHWPPLPERSFSVDDVITVSRALVVGEVCIMRGYPAILYRRNVGTMSGIVDGDGSPKAIKAKEEKLVSIHKRAVIGMNDGIEQFQLRLQSTPTCSTQYPALKHLIDFLKEAEQMRSCEASRWEISSLERLKKWSLAAFPFRANYWTFGLSRVLPLSLSVYAYSFFKQFSNLKKH